MPADANTDNTYMVTVKADDGTNTDTQDVMVMVTNEDEMGEVTLWAGDDALTMAPQVGDTITGAVMDPDGGVTGESWQWARSRNMTNWEDITGATDAAYMTVAMDEGYYLRVMATYTDAVGTDTAMEYSMPTMMVTAVGEMMGEVTLWAGTDALTMAPQVGETITGAVMDPDGGETGESWQWARSMDGHEQLDAHHRRNRRRVHGDGRRRGLLPAGDGYVHGRGGHGHGHGVLDADHDGGAPRPGTPCSTGMTRMTTKALIGTRWWMP